nr:hypothetical protein CFP56_20751 [Quercus suber]
MMMLPGWACSPVYHSCAQMIFMVASSCFVGRNLSPGCSKAWAFAFFTASWVSFFAAEGILLKASIRGAFSFDYVTISTIGHIGKPNIMSSGNVTIIVDIEIKEKSNTMSGASSGLRFTTILL